MSAKRARWLALSAAAASAAALMGAPSALAATDSTWSGLSTTSTNWSDAGNWDVSPTAPIGNLTFGDLATCDAGTATAGSACYTSIDNLGAQTANELTIGGGELYHIYPSTNADTLTLNGNSGTPNIGMSATSSGGNNQLADFGVPIVLGAAQQWNIGGNGIIYLNTISGAYPLTLDLNNGYVQANDVETSHVTVSGRGDLQLDQFAGSPEKLPDVTVDDSIGTQAALTVASTNATSGAITVSGTDNNFIVLTDKAPGETRLQAGGNVTLDGTTNVEFDIDGNDTTPGNQSSQLTTTHTVNFNGAGISLWQARDAGNCDTLTTGKTYTIVQGGTLTGQINIGGKLISAGQSATETLQSNPSDCPASAAKTTAIVNYNSGSITATIAGPPVASSSGPKISGTPTVGDKLTVSDNGSWTAAPDPTYSYQWESCSGSTCSPISGATAASYTLTNAEVGKTVVAQVTASNPYGKASAVSNPLGPVVAAITTSGGKKVTRGQIHAALAHIPWPHNRRAWLLVLRLNRFRAHFRAPVAGILRVVWTTTLRTGHGRKARRHTYVVARGFAHPRGARNVPVMIRLTRVGKRLLREHPFGLRITARDRFRTAGLGWTTFVRRFRL